MLGSPSDPRGFTSSSFGFSYVLTELMVLLPRREKMDLSSEGHFTHARTKVLAFMLLIMNDLEVESNVQQTSPYQDPSHVFPGKSHTFS